MHFGLYVVLLKTDILVLNLTKLISQFWFGLVFGFHQIMLTLNNINRGNVFKDK